MFKTAYQSIGSLSGASLADTNSYATSSCILSSGTLYIIQQPTTPNSIIKTHNKNRVKTESFEDNKEKISYKTTVNLSFLFFFLFLFIYLCTDAY